MTYTVQPQTVVKEIWTFRGGEVEASGSVYGVKSCKIVFHRGALPIHLFRHFIATMHSIADSRTDRQRYDPNSRLCLRAVRSAKMYVVDGRRCYFVMLSR